MESAIDHVCNVMQNDGMPNDAAARVKIPASLKKKLEATAATTASASRRGRLLDRFEGTPVPTDADIRNVRERLWDKLSSRTSLA